MTEGLFLLCKFTIPPSCSASHLPLHKGGLGKLLPAEKTPPKKNPWWCSCFSPLRIQRRVRSFLFALQSKQTCDIMILKSSAYRLSGAKLVVFDVKGTKQAFLKEIYDLRAKTLCACRFALALFAQARESETVGNVTGGALFGDP